MTNETYPDRDTLRKCSEIVNNAMDVGAKNINSKYGQKIDFEVTIQRLCKDPEITKDGKYTHGIYKATVDIIYSLNEEVIEDEEVLNWEGDLKRGIILE